MNWLRALLRIPYPAPNWRWLLPALLLFAWAGELRAAQSSLGVGITVTLNLPPVNQIPPTIIGVAVQGMTLDVDPGTWSDYENDPLTFTYQWRRSLNPLGAGAVDIVGATGTSYLLVGADVSRYISCRVTAHDPAGNHVPADVAWFGPVITDQPAVIVLPISDASVPLLTDENGAMQLVVVYLAAVPDGPVQVLLNNPRPDEISLSTSTLIFTPANWFQLQAVLITGLPDNVVDDDQQVGIGVDIVAPGTNYSGLAAADLVVLNSNRDIPGLSVIASNGTTVVQEGGASDTLSVVLTARPAGSVTVAVSGGGGQAIASPTSLTFTNANWNLPQPVQMSAVDDNIVNGTRLITELFAASGSGYDNVSATMPVTVLDNDSAGVEVTPTSGLVTSESGLQGQVNLRLKSQPTADVTVPLSSANSGEGTVSPAALIFTPANWNNYQTATLSGVADGVVDGDQPWTMITGLTSSADISYNGIDPPDANAINRDTNRTALLVTPGAVVVNQGGSSAYLQVRLASRPTGAVTVSFVVPAPGNSEAVVTPASLAFTGGIGSNWNLAQDVTVTGLPSGSPGNPNFIITCTPSGDAAYAVLAPVVVNGINQNISQPAVLLSLPPVMALTEGGAGTVTYGVRLSTDPGAATITVTPTSFDGQITVLAGATLTFDTSNYSTLQPVTVAAVDDAIAEGSHSGQIQHVVTGSYAAVTLTIPITDNDNAGIIATPVGGLTTTERGGTATFTVRLASQPTAPVSIPLTSSDPSQGTVSSPSLTFTAQGATAWNIPQVVTVSGTDGNNFDDGDVPYQILVGPASSSDAIYNLLPGSPVGVVNQRDDNPPTLNAIANRNINENAGPQVVMLSGISDGQAGEHQVVTLSLTNDNAALTGPLVLSYTNPAATGSITFTPTTYAFGTATITVRVSDGIAIVPRIFQVNVAWVNQLPLVVRNTPQVIGYGGTVQYQGMNADPAAPGQLVASDIETASAALAYRLVLPPAGGHLAHGGVRLGVDDIFTQAEVDAGLVSYTHDGAGGTSDGFVVQVEDPDGGQSSPEVVAITVNRSPPVLALHPVPGATWLEGGAALAIAPLAEVTDADSNNFDTGHCTVTEVGGAQIGDLLSVRNDGMGAGFIGVSGNAVTWGGVTMGTFIGGTFPDPLVVSFNTQATTAAVQALVRALTFAHLTQVPDNAPRVLRVELVDNHNDAATPQTCTLAIQPNNNAPTLGSLTLATASGAAVSGVLSAADPDGPGLSFILLSNPLIGRVTAFDALTGAFTYEPDLGATGSDSFQVAVSDSIATSAAATVTIILTDPAAPSRLWIFSDPPLEAQAGERLRWQVRVDVSGLATVPDLHFALDDAPAGLVLTPDIANASATITWPTVVGSGYVRFRVRVWDAATMTSEVQPVCLFVHPLPTMIGDLAPSADKERLAMRSVSRTSVGLIVILAITLLGVVLRFLVQHQGNSGLRRAERRDGT